MSRTLASLLVLAILQAQSSGQTVNPPLTLMQARAMALKNHPQILVSKANALRAGQLTREARSAYYPTLNGDITAAQAETNSRLGAGVINDPRLFNHAGMGLTLSQLVTDLGRTHNLVANSALQAQASNQDLQATKYDVTLGVDQAYYED
jgi:outer membrane protein